jgi:hypothetical protein
MNVEGAALEFDPQRSFSTTVISSNSGVCPGSSHPLGENHPRHAHARVAGVDVSGEFLDLLRLGPDAVNHGRLSQSVLAWLYLLDRTGHVSITKATKHNERCVLEALRD